MITHLLILDDDQDFLDLFQNMLEQARRFLPVCAACLGPI